MGHLRLDAGHSRPPDGFEGLCREAVEEWYRPGLCANSFLEFVADAAGGQVTIIEPAASEWHAVVSKVGGNVYGLTLPFPGGWLAVIPQLGMGTATTVGHEAAHILFSDVKHWDKAPAATRSLIATALPSLLNSDVDPELLTASGVMLRACHSRHELRAEFLGAVFESRIISQNPPLSRVDDFFGSASKW